MQAPERLNLHAYAFLPSGNDPVSVLYSNEQDTE